MKTFKELLIELAHYEEADAWAANRGTIEQVVATCQRGDKLAWFAEAINLDERKLSLASGYIVNQVRHLIQKKASIEALDVVIAYGEGKATDEELVAAREQAKVGQINAWRETIMADKTAESIASWMASRAVKAAVNRSIWEALNCAECAAWPKGAPVWSTSPASLKSSADIIRQYIGQDIINRVNELLSE
jgi:hypothetical protein